MTPFRGRFASAILALSCYSLVAADVIDFNDAKFNALAQDLPNLALNAIAQKVVSYDDTVSMLDISPYDFDNAIGGGSIVNGDDVKFTRTFPWFVQFGNDRCGGTHIWPGLVLTTASCIINGIPSTVRVGAIKEDDGLKLSVTAGYYFYGYFNTYPFTDNIALLVLNIDGINTDDLDLVTMNANPNYPAPASPMSAVGFGTTNAADRDARSSTLKRIDTYASISKNDCFNFWDANPNVPPRKPVNTESIVCAEAPVGDGVCRGDGGGPLFDTNFVQVGSTSFGSCADGTPVAFTRVSTYQEWLFNMTCKIAPGDPPAACNPKEKCGGEYQSVVAAANWLSNKFPSLQGYLGYLGL